MKLPYSSPKLVDYGSLTELTRAASGLSCSPGYINKVGTTPDDTTPVNSQQVGTWMCKS